MIDLPTSWRHAMVLCTLVRLLLERTSMWAVTGTPSPSRTPSYFPTGRPSRRPSSQPSMKPSVQPSEQPSTQPSCQPSSWPTSQPTRLPSKQVTHYTLPLLHLHLHLINTLLIHPLNAPFDTFSSSISQPIVLRYSIQTLVLVFLLRNRPCGHLVNQLDNPVHSRRGHQDSRRDNLLHNHHDSP